MNAAEARRWANRAAANLLHQTWEQADWDLKYGPDGDRLEAAMQRIVKQLGDKGIPKPEDKNPREPT